MHIHASSDCPCGSGHKYKRCCRPLHRGLPAPDPSALVRARYSAYAVGDATYIQDTTHPAATQWRSDRQAWAREILDFCKVTRFGGLELLGSEIDGDKADVRFRVRLEQNGNDVSFGERSRFRRQGERWLYLAALELDEPPLPSAT